MVSVIIPYNKDRGFLKRCVDSIVKQTIDCEVVLAYGDRSVAQNINYGLEKAKGEFIKVVGEDDWLPEDSLENLVNGIGDAPWIVANAVNVYGISMEVYKPETLDFKENVKHNKIHNGGTMYRTEVLWDIGGMDENLWTGEEYELHLRLMYFGYLPVYLDKEVYFYRQHSEQKYKILNRQDREKRRKEIERIQSLYTNEV